MIMNYEEIYNEDYFSGKNSFFHKLGYGRFLGFYFNYLFSPISKYVGEIKAGNVLDVGCAYGFMLQKFSDSFQKFGVDVSEYAINEARKRLPTSEFEVGNIEDELPFKKEFFDIVLMNDVVEHLENPKAALENIWKTLKKGGILYITTPNLNPIRRIMFGYADKKEHHISLFHHLNLIKLVKDLRFKIVENWTYPSGFIHLRVKSSIGTESVIICKK